jgi:hypothetical protein
MTTALFWHFVTTKGYVEHHRVLDRRSHYFPCDRSLTDGHKVEALVMLEAAMYQGNFIPKLRRQSVNTRED